MATVIPEYILLHALQAGFEYIEADFEQNSFEQKNTYLYRILQQERIQRYDYFTQAQSVLFKQQDDPRKLNIDLMYNIDIDRVPSIYITLSGEQHGNNNLSIECEQDYYQNVDVNNKVISYTDRFVRRKRATYNIFVVSDNVNEVLMLYHIIDCLIISLTPHLTLKGLYNITQGGQDVQIQNDNIPKHLFMKGLNIGFEFNRVAPDLSDNKVFSDILFKPRATGLKKDLKDTPNNLDDL